MKLSRAAAVSVLLHLLLGIALVAPLALPPLSTGRKPPEQLAQIELIQQPTPTVGDGQAEATPPPAPPPKPAAAADQPTTQQADLSPAPQPPAPPAIAQPTRSRPEAAPAVRLGHSDTIGTALVSGDNIIPPSLGSALHNDPPPYPEAAAQLGEEGTVTLLVHIDPTGTPLKVDVQESSGYELLDRAARQAVARWHFHPAQNNGIGVESDMPVRIRFVMKG